MHERGAEQAFTEFVRQVEPRLRESLVAALGAEAGREATAEALAWTWEHWPELSEKDNPAGYLYRLGRNRGASLLRRRSAPSLDAPLDPIDEVPWVEPALPAALLHLSEMQRVTVLLVHSFGWTIRGVASHLGVSAGTVQNHVARGMAKLRDELKVDAHV
jgi:DNA-directed RNA polymerase specialized sigma24 family protein